MIKYIFLFIFILCSHYIYGQDIKRSVTTGIYQPLFSKYADINTSYNIGYQRVGKSGRIGKISFQYSIQKGYNPSLDFITNNQGIIIGETYINYVEKYIMSSFEIGERIKPFSAESYDSYVLIGFQFGRSYILTFMNSVGFQHTRRINDRFSLTANYSVFADLIDADIPHTALSIGLDFNF